MLLFRYLFIIQKEGILETNTYLNVMFVMCNKVDQGQK